MFSDPDLLSLNSTEIQPIYHLETLKKDDDGFPFNGLGFRIGIFHSSERCAIEKNNKPLNVIRHHDGVGAALARRQGAAAAAARYGVPQAKPGWRTPVSLAGGVQ